jgi:hypothetical protein
MATPISSARAVGEPGRQRYGAAFFPPAAEMSERLAMALLRKKTAERHLPRLQLVKVPRLASRDVKESQRRSCFEFRFGFCPADYERQGC